MKLIDQQTILIETHHIEKHVDVLRDYLQHMRAVAQQTLNPVQESSINLPFDTGQRAEIESIRSRMVTQNLKYIVDIGIGGSNLGAKAIYDALYGYFDLVEPNRFPKMIFADTNDPEFLTRLTKLLQNQTPEEILLNVISKSGSTTETVVNLELILQAVPPAQARLVITTEKDSPLDRITTVKKLPRLLIPPNVGGRFSVFSPVGLFPLNAVGTRIDALLDGAVEMRDRCLSDSFETNPALHSAVTQYLSLRQGRSISDSFFFHPELESLGKWYRQLVGESLGKENDLDGKVVHAGITPTVSIGSTDLHSVAQLYLGGPRDKFTTFVWAETKQDLNRIPTELNFPEIVPNLSGRTSTEVMQAIYSGTKMAYRKQGLPFIEVVLPDLTEHSLGQFMQFKMLEVMYLGRLMNVNAFDQPSVELYKSETRNLLAHK